MTFAGQDKIGVTLRIKGGEDLQFLIQDNLLTIDEFSIVAEGHVVEEG